MTLNSSRSDPSAPWGPWQFPIDWALVKGGVNVKTGVFVMSTETATFTITGLTQVQNGFESFGTPCHEHELGLRCSAFEATVCM